MQFLLLALLDTHPQELILLRNTKWQKNALAFVMYFPHLSIVQLN
jgi:hypothetical protein